MINLFVQISEIDYNKISGLISFEQKKNNFIINTFNSIKNFFVKKTLSLAKYELFEKFYIFILKNIKGITDIINKTIKEKEIPVRVKDIKVSKNETIELLIALEEINYYVLAASAVRIINKESIINKKLITVLNNYKEYAEKAIKAFFMEFPMEAQNNLVIDLLTAYKQEICKLANDKLKDKTGISIKEYEVKLAP